MLEHSLLPLRYKPGKTLQNCLSLWRSSTVGYRLEALFTNSLYSCVCMCLCLSKYVYICVHEWRSQRSALAVIPRVLPIVLLEKGFLITTRGLPEQAGSPGQQAQGTYQSGTSSSGITIMQHHLILFYKGFGCWARVFVLVRQVVCCLIYHFQCPISQISFFLNVNKETVLLLFLNCMQIYFSFCFCQLL